MLFVFILLVRQTFVANGDIFDAEMESSDDDRDSSRGKRETTEAIPDNKGKLCQQSPLISVD